MRHFLPSLYTEAEPADIVMETANGTYIGKFDRSNYDNSKPAEQQPIWSIKLVATPNGSTIHTLYPDGIKNPIFVWDQKESYQYKFALS